ncbi:hypothetical protein ACHAQA_005871 [Verticillium albo-atrum]
MARLRPDVVHDDSEEEGDSAIEQETEVIELADSSSDAEESDGSGGSDGSDGSAAEGELHNGFFDTEALDASDEDSDSTEDLDEPYDEERARLGMPPFWGHPLTGSCSFPQFIRLPIELRQRVWHYFCDDLSMPRRVLDFQFRQKANRTWAVYDGPTLMARTTSPRAMLAVHHESRALYLKRYPDELRFSTSGDSPATFHFNKKTDIILASQPESTHRTNFHVPGFSDQIHHLGLEVPFGQDDGFYGPSYLFLLSLPKLEVLYMCVDVDDWELPISRLKWCLTEHAVSCTVKTEEIEAGLGENDEVIFVWHDPDASCDIDGDCKVLAGKMGNPPSLNADVKDINQENQDRLESIKLCPMRKFIGELPNIIYDTLSKARRPDKTWDEDLLNSELLGSDEEMGEHDSILDQYESDGIDDAPVPEPETDDDEGTGIEDDTLALELGAGSPGSFGGFSPVEGEIHVQEHSVYEIVDSSDEEDASPPRSPTKRQRGRQIILDDSDEEENVGDDSVMEVPAPEASRGKKRSRVVSSDDEEDEEADVQSRPSKRARPVVIDDDEEEEEEDSDVQQVAPQQNARGRGSHSRAAVVLSDSEESESESESDEEPPKTLSLAERLRLHREANPIGNASEDGSGSEDENDYTRGTYEDDSEEDEGDSNDLVLGMADDGEDDEEEDDDGDEDSYYR